MSSHSQCACAAWIRPRPMSSVSSALLTQMGVALYGLTRASPPARHPGSVRTPAAAHACPIPVPVSCHLSQIDFYEFVCLVAHELRTEEPEIEAQRYRNAFDIFDEDKSGFVDAKEMRRMMINLGESVTLEEVDDALTAFDIDGNGQIDYEEVRALTPPEPKSQAHPHSAAVDLSLIYGTRVRGPARVLCALLAAQFSKVLADHSRLGKFALPRDEGETMKHTSARRAGSVLPFTMNQSPAPALGTGGLATEVGEEPARKGFFAWLFGRRS
jgi:hypothetical protein